jgi:isopenicillin N synthase-like dioxygenase
MANTVTTHPMAELAKEATLGGMGFEVERQIPRIDMSHFADRKGDVADQLWAASIDIGFFQVYNHGIEQAVVDRAFAFAERFFTLPTEIKAKYPLVRGTNAGWEYMSQVRPSTGTPDNKESYQITLPRMSALWPSEEEIADFKAVMLDSKPATGGSGWTSCPASL